jgi:peptidoglycan-associated lipoprotein
MKKFSNVILMTLVVAMLIAAPACRTRRTVPGPKTGPETATITTSVPDISTTAPRTDTTNPAQTVTTEPDFVDETPREETMPADIEELNRWVHARGHIRDAFFNYDEAQLDEAAQAALTSSANWLRREGAAYGVLVEGHCDERGTEQYNLALGDRRANAVRDYLATLGVDARRIRTVSYGEERPFEEGHNDAAWAANRRAHLVLVRTP